jgi:tetratricopeptide (TPR) repeat protein
MSKHILACGLTLVSVILATTAKAPAELAPNVNSLTIQTANPAKTPARTNKQRQIAADTESSMRYVRRGLAAQKQGDERQALLFYYEALKLDRTNAVAFMAAGNLLGDTEEGITCMKAAALLFQQQQNREGYEMATSWLQERGARN